MEVGELEVKVEGRLFWFLTMFVLEEIHSQAKGRTRVMTRDDDRIVVQQLTGYVASRVALDPIHKEIMMSAAGQRIHTPSGVMNTIIAFSWPEIFW